MDDLVRIEVIRLPELYIVGREIRYSDDALNSGDNRLPAFWDACCEEGVFAPLEAQTAHLFHDSPAGVFLDWDLGDGDFSYIVGMLMTEGMAVPEGYAARTLAKTDAALCWIKSRTVLQTRTVPFESTAKAIADIGRSCARMKWCIDLYDRSRSTTPDENGDVIVDCYIPLD